MTTNNDMITRCPQCATAFRVTQELLGIANGTVRCGSCLSVFKAEAHLSQPNTTETPPKQEQNTNTRKAKSNTDKKPRPLIHNDDDDILIHDDLHDHSDEDSSSDENLFTFQDKNVDLKNTNQNNLFDTNETDLKHSSKEKTDESWAMDLLAEIEDDDTLSINAKRQKKTQPEAAAKTALPINHDIDQPETSSEPKNDSQPITPHTIDAQDSPMEDADQPVETITATRNDDTLLVAEIEASAPISDKEIESAMHHKTAYASGNTAVMGGFEADGLDMEWSETSHKRRWLWFLGIIVMALLLALQVAWLRFDTLSKQPRYRPYYTQVCKVVGCELAELVDTSKIRANNLVVRSHPENSNALIVDAILVNHADFEQPYPALRLEFSGINNEPIANRDFQPMEYLKGELAGSQIMPNKQPIQLSLELVDPGEAAVNYRITVISAKSTN